jgi:hypothetical protein
MKNLRAEQGPLGNHNGRSSREPIKPSTHI